MRMLRYGGCGDGGGGSSRSRSNSTVVVAAAAAVVVVVAIVVCACQQIPIFSFVAVMVQCYMKQLLQGVQYLHANWVIHR